MNERSSDIFFSVETRNRPSFLPSFERERPNESYNRKESRFRYGGSGSAIYDSVPPRTGNRTKTVDPIPRDITVYRVRVWSNIRVPPGEHSRAIEQNACRSVGYLSVLYRSCQVCMYRRWRRRRRFSLKSIDVGEHCSRLLLRFPIEGVWMACLARERRASRASSVLCTTACI